MSGNCGAYFAQHFSLGLCNKEQYVLFEIGTEFSNFFEIKFVI